LPFVSCILALAFMSYALGLATAIAWIVRPHYSTGKDDTQIAETEALPRDGGKYYDLPGFLGDPDRQMWLDRGGFWVVTGTDADGHETTCCIEKRRRVRSPAGVQGARQCSHDSDDSTEEVD